MHLAMFGATGATGQQVVQQALEQGHSVTALARKPERFAIHHSSLRIIQGDVLDPIAVEKTVATADAVLSCLGRKPFQDKDAVWKGTRNIIEAMNKLRVHRLIVESAYGAGSSRGLASISMFAVTNTLLKWAYREKEIAETEIAASELDWVIVRPVMLRNGPRTGKYRAGEAFRLSSLDWINRADVADFMLRQLTSDEWLRKTPAISM